MNRRGPQPARLGILAGSFNPPTRAHVALARTALDHVDQVLFVLPEVLPHKAYDGASLAEREIMLRKITDTEMRFTAAISEQGLFIDIAREAREHYPGAQLYFLCGRDAADRIVNWDYGEPGAFERMLDVFHLLVAPRQGIYVPPPHLSHAIHPMALCDYDDCSATLVREAFSRGEDCDELVPSEIAAIVREVYRPRPKP